MLIAVRQAATLRGHREPTSGDDAYATVNGGQTMPGRLVWSQRYVVFGGGARSTREILMLSWVRETVMRPPGPLVTIVVDPLCSAKGETQANRISLGPGRGTAL